MEKTLDLHLKLDETVLATALETLRQAGYSPESLMVYLLERTAREGQLPIKKGRSRRSKIVTASMAGIFEQGSLFMGEVLAQPADVSSPSADVTTEAGAEPSLPRLAKPNLQTFKSLQESQALVRWRHREREAALKEGREDDGLVSKLIVAEGAPLPVLETKQFRVDKTQIATDPHKTDIIRSLETLLTILSHRRQPDGAIPIDEEKPDGEYFIALQVDGVPDFTLGLIYQQSEHEVICVRYGHPRALLESWPSPLATLKEPMPKTQPATPQEPAPSDASPEPEPIVTKTTDVPRVPTEASALSQIPGQSIQPEVLTPQVKEEAKRHLTPKTPGSTSTPSSTTPPASDTLF